MSTNYSSKPRYDLLGAKDESTRQEVLEEITLPQHCPWVLFFGAWGTSVPTLFRGNGAVRMYGAETFDVTSKFCTHQTPFINLFNDNANPQMYHRLVPPNAKKAMLRVSVEIIKNEMPKYARNDDGSYKYEFNEYNERVRIVEDTIIGHRVIVHTGVEHYGDSGDLVNPINHQTFGNANIVRDFRQNTVIGTDGTRLGSIANSDATWTSTLYPIYDAEVAYEGEKGDSYAVRMQFPTTKGANPIDSATAYATQSYLWRLGVVSKNVLTGGFDLVSTAGDDQFVDVSLKQNVRTDRAKEPVSIDQIFIPKYTRPETATLPEFKGPFGQFHLYREAVEELQKALILNNEEEGIIGEESFNDEAKLNHGRYPLTLDSQYLLNFLGGFDIDGVPYYSFDTSTSAMFGGVTIVADSILYAEGGDDGLYLTDTGEPDELANYELFDSMVRQHMLNFGEGDVKWLNTAKYPVSAVWDSGFSLETKKAMLNVIGQRKDMAVFLAAQSVADYVTQNVGGSIQKVWSWLKPNTESEETAIAGTLRTIASAYPESEVYGTPVCRAVIVGQCGTLVNSLYTRKLPLTYELANKVSAFMGSADGIWDANEAYDLRGNNIIELMKDVNLSWKNENVGQQAWANGLVYAEDYDIKRLFFPAVRTVYNNETSVLNSSITMLALCYIERVCQGAWRDLTGNGKLTPAKFKQDSNEIIEERLAKRFDDRFIIVVDTFFSEADEARGFSWGCNVHLYAPNMKTVGRYTVVAHRIEDYQEG